MTTAPSRPRSTGRNRGALSAAASARSNTTADVAANAWKFAASRSMIITIAYAVPTVKIIVASNTYRPEYTSAMTLATTRSGEFTAASAAR